MLNRSLEIKVWEALAGLLAAIVGGILTQFGAWWWLAVALVLVVAVLVLIIRWMSKEKW